MSECGHDGCKREATHAPKILIPALGYPQEERQAIVCIVGIECCKDHAADFDPDDMPGLPDLALAIARAHRATVPPDVSRAWVKAVRLDSEEYRKFNLTRAK